MAAAFTAPSLPSTHRALVLHSTSRPLAVDELPTPKPGPGSAVVRVLSANVISYIRDVYNGKRGYPFPTPFVTGSGAIGRIATVGADATALEPGRLVYVDVVVRARDEQLGTNPPAMLSGTMQGSPGMDGGLSAGEKLMRGEWRDSTYAEYAKVPLENCFLLDEQRLCGDPTQVPGGFGYPVEELGFLSTALVPYGGLRDIGLCPGETIIISPATGQFGGTAVILALAMGARVIAMGRNADTLKKVASFGKRPEGQGGGSRIETVRMTDSVEEEVQALRNTSFGPQIDCVLDLSPPAAAGSTHLRSCITALRSGGRVSLMGGVPEGVAVPYLEIMVKNLLLKGKWMYDRADVGSMIRLLESGALQLHRSDGAEANNLAQIVGKYGLDEWEKAFDMAAENAGVGQMVCMTP